MAWPLFDWRRLLEMILVRFAPKWWLILRHVVRPPKLRAAVRPPMLGRNGQRRPALEGDQRVDGQLRRATDVPRGSVPFLHNSGGIPSISVRVFLSGGVLHIAYMFRLAYPLGSRPSAVQALSVAWGRDCPDRAPRLQFCCLCHKKTARHVRHVVF